MHHTQLLLKDIRIIAKNAGMSPENINQCLESMKSEVVKQELKSLTDEAVDRGKKFSKIFCWIMRVIKYFSGAFGSPTMFFTENDGENEQMFWGSDRLILKNIFKKYRCSLLMSRRLINKPTPKLFSYLLPSYNRCNFFFR